MLGNQNNQFHILKLINPSTKLIFLKRDEQIDESILVMLNYITNKAFLLGPEKKDQFIFFQNFNKKMLLVSFDNLETVLNDHNKKFINSYAIEPQNEIILIGNISSKEENYIKKSIDGVMIHAN